MNTNAAQLAAARADVERWTRQLAEAEADQDRLAAVPDDPDTARQIARERGEAHGLAQLCRDGLAAAQAKAATLERDALRASLRADADALAPAIDADQAKLNKYETTAANLAQKLRDLTGVQWGRLDPSAVDKGQLIAHELRQLTAQRDALRIAADGGDPTSVCALAELPAALRADGYAPCFAALADAQGQARRREEDAAERARVEAMRERTRQQIAAEEAAEAERAARHPYFVVGYASA